MTRAPVRSGPGYPGEIIDQINGLTREEAEERLHESWTLWTRIASESSIVSQSPEEAYNMQRKLFRRNIERLLDSNIIEEYRGKFRLREVSPDTFEKYRAFSNFETRSYALEPETLDRVVKKAIKLLEWVKSDHSDNDSISIISEYNPWTGGERVDIEIQSCSERTCLRIASFPRWLSHFENASWDLCKMNVKHLWSIIEELLENPVRMENSERTVIVLDENPPTTIPDESYAQLGEDRIHDFHRAMVKVKPELSDRINPDGTLNIE